MSTRDRLTAAAALAVALACAALAPMYAGYGWVPPTLTAVAVVAGVGALARRAGLAGALVPLAQLLALAETALLMFARDTLAWLVVPTGRTVTALQLLAGQATADVQGLAAPVPTRPALVLLAVLGAGAVAVLVDLAAVGLQRAALAGLPLLVLLAVPSGVLPGGLGWLPFTLGAAGWLGLLLVEGTDRISRWGLPLRSPRGRAAEGSSAGRVGRRIGAAALGSAVVVPALLPGLDARLLPGTGGGFGESGTRTTVTYNPITRLQGELNRPVPLEVLRYRTDDEAPDYLRMTTLDRFDGVAWRASELRGREIDGRVPAPAGSLGSPARTVRAQITMGDALRSQWLPTPVTPDELEVDGTWRWDPRSQTVYATTTNTDRLEEYEVRATRVLPEAAGLRGPVGDVPEEVEPYTGEVDVQPDVAALTRTVTAGLTDPYEQAVALQRFFRDSANQFVYDTRTSPLRGRDALSAFLRDRRGYCEQYASAMAVMLRVLGLPSRVAVGFTPGAPQPDGSRRVTTDDAHAWPEAWFEGAGWVRFEPTPVDEEREIVPSYTLDQADAGGATAPQPGESAAPLPSAGPSQSADPRLREDEVLPAGDPLAASGDDDALPPARVLLGGLLLGLAVTPALVGALGRRLRARTAGPLGAWEQVRDDAADVGHVWRPGDSPQAAADHLAGSLGLAAPAQEALRRVAAATARARYAPPGADTPDPAGLRGDVRAVRAGLLAAVRPARRARAVLAPPSTLRWATGRTASLVADVLDRVDDLLAAVARRLRRAG